ncbi:MAG: MarR family winged helix-turn-helix transcriptional regulator [Reyranella sp.]|uniref:MarR family winged helix-turn-helix transcriptional regulator n=1 Tax=Reyranella sp. TaxID=1929291 RepID=UPI003D0BC199
MSRANPLPIENSLFFRMVLAVNLTARPFARLYSRKYQLNLTEWRVMVALANVPGVSANEVARLCGLDKMTVSRSLASMMRHGYVARRPARDDRRRLILALTSSGRRVFAAIAPSGAARERSLFGDFSAAERAQFGHLLDRLVERARQLPDA